MILREDCLQLPYLSSIIIGIHILRFSRSLIGENSMQIKDVGLAAQKINDNISRLEPVDKGLWAIDSEGRMRGLDALTSLSRDIQFEGMGDCKTLYVAGALVDGFLEKVRKNKDLKQVELVVRDFTKIFVTPQQLRLFVKGGGRVSVLHKSKLIAVTVNPTSPSGYVLDSDMLCDRLSEAIGLPVYDLLKNDNLQ